MTGANRTSDNSMANILLLLAIGLTVSVWLIVYTDVVPVTNVLFGVGGILAWAALVIPVLTPARRQQLQCLFDVHFLQKRWATTFIIAVGLVSTGFLFGHGTIEIDNRSANEASAESRRLSIREVHGTDEIVTPEIIEYNRIVPKDSLSRTVKWVPWRKTVAVKVSGLPQVEIYVHSFRRSRLLIAGSFRNRPGVLVAPSATMVEPIRNSTSHLRVCIDDSLRMDEPDYNGQTFWLGVHHDVEVPHFGQTHAAPPVKRALPGASGRLAFGQKVTAVVTITNQGSVQYAHGRLILKEDDAVDAFSFFLELKHGQPRGFSCDSPKR